MSQRTREIVFLILQCLDEEKFKETVHKLEQESGFFFNLKYFEDEVHNGNWEEVEGYLSAFTNVDDNLFSMKTLFEIRKQKYLEALDKHDRSKAEDILVKDLTVFAKHNEALFNEISQLLTLENFRENEQLSKYGDIESARAILIVDLKKLIETNPIFRDKLQFPNLKSSRLRTLINQGLNWQHQVCKYPSPYPVIETLFVDHSCRQPNGFPPLGAHGPRMVSSLSRELVFLILQFLNEQEFKETLHKLEEESGFFFNMRYFEDEVNNGNWDEVERYLSGFTEVEDNEYLIKMSFEIRKQKYLEALDRHDHSEAIDILVKDLEVLATFNEDLFNEISQLLTSENFRENEKLPKYVDTKSARSIVLVELKKLIEANPVFHDKLQFPYLKPSRLRTLIDQSLNWQHQLCKIPRPNPDIKTLFVDHSCGQPNGARAPSPANNPLLGSLPKAGVFPPLGAHGPFQPTPAPVPTPLAGWMSNPSTVTHPAVSGGTIGLGAPSIPAALKYLRTPPTNPSIDYPSGDSDHVSKRTRPMGISDEVNLPVNVLPVTFQGHGHSQAFNAPDDLPKTVTRTLNQGSSPMSMDFHPVQQTLLLVGTNVGDIGLWEVGSRERLVLKNFKVWDLGACTMSLQSALVKDPCLSVNCVTWSPDGSLFGVAYSKHIVQIYSYHGADDVRQHLEIDAHVGGVNDLAFSHPNKQLCVITCGDDKTIKVWDAATGVKHYTLEGHEAPVYSVFPHHKENIQFMFSTALDGKIKAWLYDNMGSRVDYDAPGRWCTTMAYSADGTRLFSCGTSKEGESYIVEWNESEGAVKRTYQGFRKRSLGVVQFDTTRNRFLAAGDDFSIKFWDMDNVQLLTNTDADGGLPASPRIRFNKDGTLLAVSGNDNVIKILANTDGIRLLCTFENLSYDASRTSETVTKPTINPISATAAAASATSAGLADTVSSVVTIAGMNGDTRNLGDVKPRITDETNDKSKIWKLTEFNEPSQCRSLRLPENMRITKISRLIYTNSGNAILALASNAIHLLWKWQRSDRNSSGKATASVSPQLWQPSSGILMTNDVADTNPEDAVPCFALSKNDSYLISASGGKISLFNMMTFKTMTTFMRPPPAATFLAFHPQDNNIIAIGMDDSTIHIYNVRVDEVQSKLKGHSKRITGLAFSHVLNVLVSSGADAQLSVWSSDGWEKQKSRFLQVPTGRTPTAQSDTCVQFHQDQIHFLVVHETQLAIYETTKLECVKQWVPRESAAPISHATFSCDSQLVYASFLDATVCVFNAAHLRLRCRISPSAYLPASVSNSNVHPLVIAAHPQQSNQFALGLSDGGVHVFEPLESEGKWGVPPPVENGSASSVPATPTSAGLADTVSSVVTISGMNGDTRNLGDVKPRITEETNDKSKIWKVTEFNEPSQCRSLRLPENMRITKVNVLPVTSPGHGQNEAFNTPDDLPKIVKRTLNQGSSPTSMDFHPAQPTVLLVGTKVGDIGLWEVSSGKTLVLRNFKVWDLGKCSMSLQAALVKDPSLSVNYVTWSPEGSLFGVAYSKNIVQIYSYHGDNDVRQHMEIDAHVGGVNDLAFSHPNKQLVIITCGDDKTIKVWDAVTGAKQYTFEGHEAPVYSVCPHYKKNVPFIFSTAVDGKIKAWLYDNLGSRVDFDAPGHWCTTMAYSTDGTRLFSCGTSKEGESYIVEWNECEGAVKRNYQGFQKRSLGVVQFDTTRNRFLAAGDDFSIKFWNMDNVQLLTTIDADGGLPACPRICFNKDGTLLAVSTYENGIKILANSDGIQLLRATEYLSYNASRTSEMVTKPAINPISAVATSAAATSATIAGLADKVSFVVAIAGMNGDNVNLEDVKPGLSEETNAKSKKLTDITELSQFQSFKLSENVKLTKSGSLKPSDDCKFAYMSPTVWNKLAHGSRKAAVLENVKGDWKKVAIVFLVFLIVIYSFGSCPFKRSNSEDNAYLRWKRYP